MNFNRGDEELNMKIVHNLNTNEERINTMFNWKHVYQIVIALSVFGVISPVNAQGETDSITNRLPKIELRNDQWESPAGGYWSNGMYMQHPDSKFNRHYFSAGDSIQNVRVNYLATNLAMAVKPVPSAYNKLQSYKILRILVPTLMVSGVTTAIAGFATQINGAMDENGNIPPPNLTVPTIGLVIALTSWIPRIISKGMVEESVTIYNSEISSNK